MIKSLGHSASIIVGVGFDSAGRSIPERDRRRFSDTVKKKYPNIFESAPGASSWIDQKGKTVNEPAVIYTVVGVGMLFEAEGIAEFIRATYFQQSVVLLFNSQGYIV